MSYIRAAALAAIAVQAMACSPPGGDTPEAKVADSPAAGVASSRGVPHRRSRSTGRPLRRRWGVAAPSGPAAFTHLHGHGDPVKIAETVRQALALTKTPPPAPPAAASSGPLGMDTAQVFRTLGFSGRLNGGVYQVSVPRAETIREGDFEVPPSMGLGTAINFQPTGGGKAAITGDFVMIGNEINPVNRALRENGIEVTSLHNHLLTDEPRLFFMHFWANDDALKLARGLRRSTRRTPAGRLGRPPFQSPRPRHVLA